MERIHRRTRQSMHDIHNLKKLLVCAKRNQLDALQHHQAMWTSFCGGTLKTKSMYHLFLMIWVISRDVSDPPSTPSTRAWEELEYRIDVCRVTRVGHIAHL
ncbi:hypothetical protein C0J52_17523 [Blattella germanica]|nr:hypothetical protein C0J52_17523 [Blattella germanica]